MGPWIILLKGCPGVGKSTVAVELARTLRAALLDKDDVKNAFPTNDVEGRDIVIDWNRLSYSVLLNLLDA